MRNRWAVIITPLLFFACASESPRDPLEDYVERHPSTILDAPTVDAKNVAPANRAKVRRGEYMIELLGCGSCHTNGALVGDPDLDTPLSGSDIGIAFTTPLAYRFPGVVYPPNITPDYDTGIGGWSDEQIIAAIRAGASRHGARPAMVMPWQAYSIISDEDAEGMVHYLRSIEPVKHRVPDNVPQGEKAAQPYIHFGIYEKK